MLEISFRFSQEKYIIRNFHPLVLFYFTGFMFFLLSSTLAIRLVYLWLDYGYVPVMTALALLFTSSNAILFSLFAMWFDMEVNKDLLDIGTTEDSSAGSSNIFCKMLNKIKIHKSISNQNTYILIYFNLKCL